MQSKLDTLAQLSTKGVLPPKNKALSKSQLEQLNYKKKARSKSINDVVIFRLIDLKSPLLKSYWQTFHCNNVQLQEGGKITSRYCNQRWCQLCNRIRTAKQINGYKEPISKLKDPQFVTLTTVNVPGKELKIGIEQMNYNLMRIRKNLLKTYKLKLKGLKKIECTYSVPRGDYNPHFHLIIEGKEVAEHLVSLWLKQYPTADRGGQKIQPAGKDTLMELCKYFTKVITKGSFYPRQMDIIFRAMKGKRTFQPIGLKKVVTEEVEDQIGQEQSFIAPQNEIFVWEQEAMDWISASGEVVADYSPSQKHLEYLEKISNNKPIEPKENESRTKEAIHNNKSKQLSTEQIEQAIKDFWT